MHVTAQCAQPRGDSLAAIAALGRSGSGQRWEGGQSWALADLHSVSECLHARMGASLYLGFRTAFDKEPQGRQRRQLKGIRDQGSQGNLAPNQKDLGGYAEGSASAGGGMGMFPPLQSRAVEGERGSEAAVLLCILLYIFCCTHSLCSASCKDVACLQQWFVLNSWGMVRGMPYIP